MSYNRVIMTVNDMEYTFFRQAGGCVELTRGDDTYTIMHFCSAEEALKVFAAFADFMYETKD